VKGRGGDSIKIGLFAQAIYPVKPVGWFEETLNNQRQIYWLKEIK